MSGRQFNPARMYHRPGRLRRIGRWLTSEAAAVVFALLVLLPVYVYLFASVMSQPETVYVPCEPAPEPGDPMTRI